ncbi:MULTISPECIES: hypothetical protein [Bacillus cereus group]|nr:MULTISPECIES: hypothetical protein [Bacillus cereus group]MDH2862606.1 hypothetical protein [Bacillus cytotoxicus]MDH2870572.1 hypothetical protein [Bacillus cytotoxicus]MDH2874533.1 hypothetical protein [Bacillus cytotoxicus]MDH2878675.1 hypothetical protein [Bacillus cytotoxicus]MDH2894524.1 hypothetical protein [Bacillus cytotoxicus]
MPESEVLLLEEIQKRYNTDNQFLRVDKEFNERLYQHVVKIKGGNKKETI